MDGNFQQKRYLEKKTSSAASLEDLNLTAAHSALWGRQEEVDFFDQATPILNDDEDDVSGYGFCL